MAQRARAADQNQDRDRLQDALGRIILEALARLRLEEDPPPAPQAGEEEPGAEPEAAPAEEAAAPLPEPDPAVRAQQDLVAAREAGQQQAAQARADPLACGGERFYAVWLVPDAVEDLRGVHYGGTETWYFLLEHLPDGYTAGVHLRRLDTLALAVGAYGREARRHQAPLPAQFFRWP